MSEDHEDDRRLTWTLLLARCTDLARAVVALPQDGDGGRYRRSVGPIISLHAVTHALSELELLEPAEVPLALDRAEILIREAGDALDSIWRGRVPDALVGFVHDAVDALAAFTARGINAPPGVEWLIVSDRAEFDHPGELALALASAGLALEVHLPSPGVTMFRGSVAGYADLSAAGGEAGGVVSLISAFLGDAVGEPAPAAERRQVYRQFDFAAGGPVRDVVTPVSSGKVPGQPLLVPVLIAGEVQPVPMAHRRREAMGTLPVEVLDG